MVRALVADDSLAVLAALVETLDADDDVVVVATASSGHEAVPLAREHRPEIAIVDLDMTGGGVALVRQLATLAAPPHVLVFSGRDDLQTVRAVVAAGADAFVAKGQVAEDFAALVRRCAAGERFVIASCAVEVSDELGWSRGPAPA